jgi:hypothetical protein
MLSKLRSLAAVEIVGNTCDHLPPSKLPTLRQVLALFFCHLEMNHSVRDSARACVAQVLELWKKTKVPVQREDKAIENIEKYYKEWRGLTRHMKDRPPTDKGTSRRDEFEATLDNLFDISLKGANKMLCDARDRSYGEQERKMYEEEILFLEDQRGPRLGFIANIDIA